MQARVIVQTCHRYTGGPKRNVLGMMPHPERMSEPLHGGTDGRALFDAVVGTIGSTAS